MELEKHTQRMGVNVEVESGPIPVDALTALFLSANVVRVRASILM